MPAGQHPPQRRFNNGRKIRQNCQRDELALLADKVHYTGNPEHKTNPGDYGLTPLIGPNSYKTLCTGAGVDTIKKALRLLKLGISRGLISEQFRGGFPQNIWVVTDEGVPLQATLENRTQGTYHGYPIPVSDPFRSTVLKKWSQA